MPSRTPCLTRVLVAHEHQLLSIGVMASLRQHADLDVQTLPVEDCVDAIGATRPDVVITDQRTALACLGGLARGARVRVVALAESCREAELRAALEAGVHGYLLMSSPAGELLECVRQVARGARHLSAEVALRAAASLCQEELTQRESEVLSVLALGKCNKAIASELSISVGTVKAHVKAIMTKLQASTRTQAATTAVRRGLIDACPAPAPPSWRLAAPREAAFALR